VETRIPVSFVKTLSEPLTSIGDPRREHVQLAGGRLLGARDVEGGRSATARLSTADGNAPFS
jgi:hypothetical protein